ncbi:DUF397 domain-containing protein [Saccharothrix sp. Mg75]|uniref:DUF397 domain-containing protein n=1 Tax=Saccharothrix sp. Mg75 TaxID=3445357 RepID=UPI003EF01916
MTDLIPGTWRKSSRSAGNNGNCVELAQAGDGLAVRDSKNPGGGAVVVGAKARAAFLAAVREDRAGR